MRRPPENYGGGTQAARARRWTQITARIEPQAFAIDATDFTFHCYAEGDGVV